jgi:hypothetical protein
MMTDGHIDELHNFAAKIGMKREWFQDNPLHLHYDLFDGRINKALQAGAIMVSKIELVKKCSKMAGMQR